jgi:hypothetical protein
MGKFDYITNNNPGLGDCLSVFTTSLPVFSPSPHFKSLRKYSSLPVFRGEGIPLRVELLHDKHPGQHLFNKARIEAGDEPLEKPRPLLDKIEYKPQSKIIAFAFDVGAQVIQQRALINPKARALYSGHREMFQQLVNDYYGDLTFVEVGQKSFEFNSVDSYAVGKGLNATIDILSSCEKFVCIHSGLEHLANAISIPTCGIINIPALDDYGNPNQQEMDWLSPQVYRLHMDGGNSQIDEFNRENLEKFLCLH